MVGWEVSRRCELFSLVADAEGLELMNLLSPVDWRRLLVVSSVGIQYVTTE